MIAHPYFFVNAKPAQIRGKTTAFRLLFHSSPNVYWFSAHCCRQRGAYGGPLVSYGSKAFFPRYTGRQMREDEGGNRIHIRTKKRPYIFL